ncbi:hypothetical protein SAMN05444274_104397 [Mariniphaga anaerophila]|uniref:Uncharacterized protein n=1 Tax=Mariniphaga anaerophila TaxID=1484053 RepID=A0A1M5ANL1_9BACT|nr:hypothetical protein [Mariniphaga anaerophila]SHF31502.1 hypothetical protein SAMN05444274_104397 [Mariniphaga anaerophila]
MSEKDYIEELILNNMEELNQNEPPAGHFERFQNKLEEANQKKKAFPFKWIWKAAAAAVFAFLVINQAVIWFAPESGGEHGESASTGMTLASVSPEYEEVEFYYTSAISGGLNQWERLVAEGLISEEEQQMMNGELEEFEEVFKKLQADLSANPEDGRVINAMIEYYQTKLSLINMIVEKLEEVKQKTNTDYEAES